MEKSKYDLLTSSYENELMETLKGFIAIDSVYDESTVSEENPFGVGVSKALNYIAGVAKKDGFEVTNYGNKVVEIICGSGEKNITILAHADVVPEGQGWDQNPFELVEKDGVLTARGVADDKGPLLSAYYGMKALRDNNLIDNYRVRFIVGGNEESGSLGVEYYFKTLKKEQPTFGFSPDAEYPLIYAEKGIYTFNAKGKVNIPEVISLQGGLAANSVIEKCVIRLVKGTKFLDYVCEHTDYEYDIVYGSDYDKVIITGLSAHGSTPEQGKNAGIEALRLLADYANDDELKKIVGCYLDLQGKGLDAYCYSEAMECASSMNVGIIDYANGELELTVNFRYVDTCDIEKTKKAIDAKILPLKVTDGSVSDLLFYDKKSPLVSTLLKVYQEETGDYEHQPMAIGGGTYAKEADNIVAFGMEFPGWNSKMHSIGEQARKQDLIKSMGIYARAIVDLGKKANEN